MTEEDLEKQLIPLYWLRPAEDSFRASRACIAGFGICATPRRLLPGMNIPLRRFRTTRRERRSVRRFLPGKYTVKLTVNGQSYSAPSDGEDGSAS